MLDPTPLALAWRRCLCRTRSQTQHQSIGRHQYSTRATPPAGPDFGRDRESAPRPRRIDPRCLEYRAIQLHAACGILWRAFHDCGARGVAERLKAQWSRSTPGGDATMLDLPPFGDAAEWVSAAQLLTRFFCSKTRINVRLPGSASPVIRKASTAP